MFGTTLPSDTGSFDILFGDQHRSKMFSYRPLSCEAALALRQPLHQHGQFVQILCSNDRDLPAIRLPCRCQLSFHRDDRATFPATVLFRRRAPGEALRLRVLMFKNRQYGSIGSPVGMDGVGCRKPGGDRNAIAAWTGRRRPDLLACVSARQKPVSLGRVPLTPGRSTHRWLAGLAGHRERERTSGGRTPLPARTPGNRPDALRQPFDRRPRFHHRNTATGVPAPDHSPFSSPQTTPRAGAHRRISSS